MHYDTWRTTHPDDLAKPSRFMPETVETYLCINVGEVLIDAMGVYSTEFGGLVSVKINGKDIPADDVTRALALLGVTTFEWDRDLDGPTLHELTQKAAQDAEADYGDWQYEQSRD